MTHLAHNPTPPLSSSPWPWQEYQTIHPVIASLTPEVESSIKSVAQYIAKNESDPYLQIKAIHDYVVSRVTYDLDVLKTGRRPSQDARTVFKTHKAVCEGYANLFLELGQEVGLDVAYIRGKVRQDLAPLDLIPEAFRLINPTYDWTLHAWNAVKVGGYWQLVDTTWDDSRSDWST
jgi:transglutaminase/protease-like cytokinesis protein 3